MAIDQEVIERAKRTDLVALVQSKGIQLKKNGKSHVGLCPFHADKNPSLSISPSKNLFQCFGCGVAGDAIRFVELLDQVSFPEAVKRLSGEAGHLAPLPQKPAQRTPLTAKAQKLLARVVGHYQHCLGPDSRGLRYLKEERGITHTRTLTHFGAGYADGSLKEILPEDEEIAASLKQIGILNARGNEAFYRCVVFPLYSHKGAVVGLYGRNIGKGRVSHRYLPGPRTGVVNRQAVKGTDSVLLTESIIDAVTLYDRGFTHVIPIYGVNGLLDEHLSLLQRHVGSAHLVFDADDAGQKAAERVAARLKEKQIKAYPVILPVKDANLYFKSHSAEAFKQLLAAAGPKDPERTDKEAQPLYTPTDHGFIFGTAGRQYEVKGICRSDTQLKATVKASREVAGGRPFELSTIDLYSSRSRLWFGKLCAELFGASEAQVKADMDALLERVEAWRPPAAEQATAALPTGKAKAEALRF